ncbi:Conjugal transfer mating pair stabilization protein TraN (plasmid) [Rhodovastum atsumiense]|uniref:Conjugal transfer mating pair stabilization protein TraN n=1 Tax=Rhodovastum atsumiense TaxID=504468 RepID=A0A5M6IJS0_9PROT|nr:conjugal transfer mating pair stabilization protein TraN [Rhodovastum atsumiense]KAA5608513.1 conjugal transfer mating pair stabilization protein TraN [Rhodovastum atsumiense]CAH2605790.1 Conjugal transfer mating pair stabilization protein TraN [Rhodovastum atsumiense]
MTGASLFARVLRRGRLGVSLVASGCLLWGQIVPAYADSLSDAAARGNAAAAAIQPNATSLFGQDASGNIVLNPGTPKQVTLSPSQIVPGSGAVTAPALSASGTSLNGRTAIGATAQHSLAGGNDSSAAAYSTLLQSYNRTTPNLRSDAVFGTSRDVFNTLARDSSLFGDCTTTRTYTKTNATRHVPDYRQCDRHLVQTQNLMLAHEYNNGILAGSSGDVRVVSCGDGCLDVTLGRIGDNYWVSPCGIFENSGAISILSPDAIISAQVIRAKFDDRMQVYLGDTRVWQSDTVLPPETGSTRTCDLKTSWDYNPGDVDVTSILKRGGTIPFKIRVSVAGAGEGYVQMRVRYNAAALSYDSWSNAADVSIALATLSRGSVCKTTVTCTAMPLLDGDGCTPQAIGRVCPAWFTSATTLAFSPYVNPLCKQVQVSATCNPAGGDMACYTDYQGNTQCYHNDGTNTDNCASLRNDASCSYVNTECIMTDATTGACMVAVDTYDCGTNVPVPGQTTVAENTVCAGPVRCMGTECTSTTVESNGTFAEVAARLQAVQMMEQDGSCSDPSDAASCRIFPGDDKTCKVAVGGYVNCCAKAVSVNLADYMKLVFSVRSINSAIMKLGADSTIRGSWEMMKQPIDYLGTLVDSAWDEAQASFTSAANSVWTNLSPNSGELISTVSGEVADSTSSGVLGSITASLTNQLAEWTYNVFGETAANMLFSASAGGGQAFTGGTMAAGGVQFGGGGALVGTAITWIGAAYAVYSIATTLIKIIYACETSEYELDTKRQLKECHYVGSYCATDVLGLCVERKQSYCCFNTPLARIMQEQARSQLGISWGTAKAPHCDGLTLAQFSAVDWDRVDLSEWIALLSTSGLLADTGSVTVDSLTGAGNALATGGTRIDAVTRSVERLDDLDLPSTMDRAKTQLQSTTGPLP